MIVQRLLLDTHVFVWSLSKVAELADNARAAIADPRNDVFVSAITGWEISVKRAKGRIRAPDNLEALVTERGFTHLPLTFHHAEQAGNLPMHHRDPFDRMLVAQSQLQSFVLVTRDHAITKYDTRILISWLDRLKTATASRIMDGSCLLHEYRLLPPTTF